MYIRQDIQRERIAGCGSEVGANIDSVKMNREEGTTGTEGHDRAKRRHNKVERGVSVNWVGKNISTWVLRAYSNFPNSQQPI
jgi:hypothetical protein